MPELVLKQNHSFLNRAVSYILHSNSNEEVAEAIKEEYPHYDPCDTTLSTPYDSAMKERLVDKQPESLSANCLVKERTIIKDAPMKMIDMCCCTPCPPPPEKPFVRLTGDCKPSEPDLYCDSRIDTIASKHPMFAEANKEGDKFFNSNAEKRTHNNYESASLQSITKEQFEATVDKSTTPPDSNTGESTDSTPPKNTNKKRNTGEATDTANTEPKATTNTGNAESESRENTESTNTDSSTANTSSSTAE